MINTRVKKNMLQTWNILVMVKQHVVQIGGIDGETEHWGRSHQTRRCRGVNYPESYITKCATHTKEILAGIRSTRPSVQPLPSSVKGVKREIEGGREVARERERARAGERANNDLLCLPSSDEGRRRGVRRSVLSKGWSVRS